MPRSIDYHESLIQSLKDPKEAEAYLNAALKDRHPRAFWMALRNVAEARGVTTHRRFRDLLSSKTTPDFEGLAELLAHLGFRLAIESREAA